MKAIWLCPVENANLVLPPLQDTEGGLQLQYYDESGELRGGLEGAIGEVPLSDLGMCVLDTSAETATAMVADGRWTLLEVLL